jgi:subtilisin family serine protease
MTDSTQPTDDRPAFTRDTAMVRLGSVEPLEGITPMWAWGGATGRGARVAVIDSGVEADHPMLEGCVEVDDGVVLSQGTDGDVQVAPGAHPDVFGHGTACAGIIHSIAPEARITSIRVLGPRLNGRSDVFLRGLQWAIEHDFDVVNLSLGSSRREFALAFHDLCDEAYFRNTVLVTAANNVQSPSFPSLYASVLSVACNTTTDPFRFHYNPEPPTEFLARGIDVEVAWKGGGTTRATGNSYAAPHVAGLAALIRSKHPELRAFQLKTVLWACAANVVEAPVKAGRFGTVATRASRILRPIDHPPPPNM